MRTKKMSKCSDCQKETLDKLLFFYVDGNNGAITKNSKCYCWKCYNKHHNDKIGIKTVLQQLGYRVIIGLNEILIAKPEEAQAGNWHRYDIKSMDQVIIDFGL